MKRTRLAAAFLAAVMAMGILAGCAKKEESSAPPAATTPQPAKPKTLNIVNSALAVHMDIHRVTDSISFTILDHFYETLFTLNEKGEVKPGLATEITSSLDAKTHTIKLRKGVKFTDGSEFNAEVAKFNLEWILNADNKAAYRSLISMVDKIEAKDPETLVITLKTPLAPITAHLAQSGLSMMSIEARKKGPDFASTNVVGTGAYVLKEYVKDQKVVMTVNPNYWGAKPKVEEVTFRVVKENGPRIIEVESGNADVALKLPPTEIARLKANNKLDLTIVPTVRVIFMQLNTQKPPFNNPKVRQAVNYAIDKESIVKNLLGGAGAVMDGVMSPSIFGYTKQTPYNYDPNKAKQMLADAGVKPGTKITLHHPIGRYLEDAKVSEAIATQLKAVGFEVELKGMEVTPYFELSAKSFEESPMIVSMLGWSTPTLDADYALYNLFHSSQWPKAGAGYNRAFYKNAEVDKLLDEGRSTVEVAKRKAAYEKAQKLIWEDAPWIFLHFQTEVQAIRKGVTGFEVHPTERMTWLRADVTPATK